MALAALTAAAAESGAWEEAAAAAEELLTRAGTVVAEPDRPEHHNWPHQALLTLAEAALVHGQPGEALKWLDTIVPDGCPPNEFWSPDEALSLRAWALAEQGEEMARATMAAAQEALAAVADARMQAIIQAQLAQAALGLGEVESARGLYEAARPALEACGSHARLRALEERLDLRDQGRIDEGRVGVGVRDSSPTLTPTPTPTRREALPDLRVRLLGGFECAVEGRTILPEEWGSRKARNVFKYLLLRRGRPVPVDDILEEFWPDLTIDGARHALRSTLHRIRRALEPDRPARAPSAFLQVADDTVCLQTGPNVAVDLFEFEDRLGQSRRREAQGDAAGANQLREEAVALYTGDLLPHDASESWAMGTREWLREQYLSALARLAEAAIARSEPAAALPFAEKMLDADPIHEPGIRTLVRSLADLGRGSEAVRRFDLFAQRLDRDLGLIPERETRELVEGLRRAR
jgi:DNA-binding SARP family transcriptional activator